MAQEDEKLKYLQKKYDMVLKTQKILIAERNVLLREIERLTSENRQLKNDIQFKEQGKPKRQIK